jgi:hypothetical protein
MLHAVYLGLQVTPPPGGEAISLASSWALAFLKPLNPTIVEQAAQRAVKRAGRELDATVAHFFDVFQDRVPVSRLPRQAEHNQQHRLGKRQGLHSISNDMSHNDILKDLRAQVKEKRNSP